MMTEAGTGKFLPDGGSARSPGTLGALMAPQNERSQIRQRGRIPAYAKCGVFMITVPRGSGN
jgi:hypothetical protein